MQSDTGLEGGSVFSCILVYITLGSEFAEIPTGIAAAVEVARVLEESEWQSGGKCTKHE